MALHLANSFESGFFAPKGTSVLPDITLALAAKPESKPACEDSCKGLPTMQHAACIATCRQTGKTPQEAFAFPGLTALVEKFGTVVVYVLGAILLILAIVLLTK